MMDTKQFKHKVLIKVNRLLYVILTVMALLQCCEIIKYNFNCNGANTFSYAMGTEGKVAGAYSYTSTPNT